MSRTLYARIPVACLLWAITLAAGAQAEFSDTRLQQIADPLRTQFPSTEPARSDEALRATIRTAAAIKGWRVETDTPGRIELSLTVRDKHKARVELTYLRTGYVIRYLSSENLLYEENAASSKGPARAIHANYNVWVRELAQSINAGLGTAALAEVVSSAPPLAGAVAAGSAARAGVASSRRAGGDMPADGTRWRYGYRDQQYRGGERIFTVEVASVEGSVVQERLSVEGGDISQATIDAGQLRFVTRPVSSSAAVVELAPYSPQLYKKIPQKPTGYPSVAGAMWDIGTPSYSEESTTVPAGAFTTVRVEVKGTSPAYGQSSFTMATTPARFTYTAWYSPELKRYVKIRHQTWNRWNTPIGDEVVQLLGYQPGK